ncbi:MAG: aquaporin [Planctomycetota bacterium]|nr:aquaporin [Planctomycetota bacterium]
MRSLLAELLGTYFLVFVVGLFVGAVADFSLAPFAIAGVLAVCVYAFAHASGAHFNPAVTVAVWMRKKIGMTKLAGYLVAQLLGAFFAVFTLSLLVAWTVPAPLELAEVGQVILAEVIFTFLLVTVVLNVAATKATEGNGYFGAAIGGAVFVGAICVGSISGAVFNPAVATGLVAMGALSSSKLIVFVGSQLLGGIAAAWVHGIMNPAELESAAKA